MSKRNYTEATKSALFALSTGCYFPDCKQPSVTFFGDEPGKKVDIAHIHAEEPGGPRHIKMPPDEYDAFSNLILLCGFHHKKVDNKATWHLYYPAEELRKWKTAAEKDLRAKIDGLDNLTEDRLEQMLDHAARSTMAEVEGAIESLRLKVSESAGEILQLMLDKIETHYLNEEAVAMLDSASRRLGDLESNAATLSMASHRFGDLETNAATMKAAADRLAELPLSSMPRWLDNFRIEYKSTINTAPDFSDIVSSIEYAGQRVIERIEREAASIDVGAPPILVNHPQRWRYFSAGVIVAFVLVVIGVVLKATGTI